MPIGIQRKYEEHRVFGPPGCGKTTYLARAIGDACQKYGAGGVIVASFTKAAAAELVSRNLPVPADMVGTLHALAWRSLHRPTLAESKEQRAEWNEFVRRKDSAFMLTAASGVDVEDAHAMAELSRTEEMRGDYLLTQYNHARARLKTIEDIEDLEVVRFAQLWENWKREADRVDFTDIIIWAIDHNKPSQSPMVGFFDECQDFSPLELKLVRKWAEQMQHIVIAGDDDQCIYSFKGANAEAFLSPPVPDKYKRVLSQSFRLPRAIHRLALEWSATITRREQKHFLPRASEGKVDKLNVTWNSKSGAQYLLDDVQEKLSQDNERGDKKTVMLLATCSYQLDVVKAELRRRNLLFHNPYRKQRADWNPLGQGRTLQRVLAFLAPRIRNGWDAQGQGLKAREIKLQLLERECVNLRASPLWSKAELALWSELVKVTSFWKRGTRKEISELPGAERKALLGSWLADYYLNSEDFVLSANGFLKWLIDHCASGYEERLRYISEIIASQGLQAIEATPRIVLGTIHSVKGGEADCVYLCPDISTAAYEDAHDNPDALRRLFYVAITRAREELIICAPANTQLAIDLGV